LKSSSSDKNKVKEPKKIGLDKFSGSEINKAIKILSPLNKNWNTWYKPGPQRTSVSKLLNFCKEDGNDLGDLVNKAITNRGKQYEVQIFNPTEMVEKYDKLNTKKKSLNNLTSENVVTTGRYDKINEKLMLEKERKEKEYKLKQLQANQK